MSSKRTLQLLSFGCAGSLLAGCGAPSESPAAMEEPASASMPAGNPISGEGMPNPNPVVTQNWGDLPEGREWGSTAGVDIDPNDGHLWAYERCGAGTFGADRPGTRTLSEATCANKPSQSQADASGAAARGRARSS